MKASKKNVTHLFSVRKLPRLFDLLMESLFVAANKSAGSSITKMTDYTPGSLWTENGSPTDPTRKPTP